TGALEITDSNDYYPFGMNHLKTRNAYFGAGNYRNYKYQEQELQETGFYSFKWRNYMPDVGRFFNIDPLSEKYSYQSHYNFSENRVIDARELEGLEAVKFNEGTKNLIIAIQGWDNGNPDPGKTQVKPDKNGFATVLLEAYSSRKDTQVAVFGASWISRTPKDISTSIKDFRKQSPDGKLIIVGHSLGADNGVTVSKDNPEVKIDKLITLDISDPIGVADNKIPSNVAEATNYYQTNNPFVGGTQVVKKTGNSTSKITNTETDSKTNHTNIDENYSPNVLNDVKQVIPTK
ncbi:RHS repeat-associated core domain-containing protein, partial [Chryseobacterium sp. MIQD13]|uniref:RHS repeat-associated core domain-containing protein n=1 Tax=Chryseobacterium sp. MIQD13 TaxID=3422310 RepID=UPI003D2D983E